MTNHELVYSSRFAACVAGEVKQETTERSIEVKKPRRGPSCSKQPAGLRHEMQDIQWNSIEFLSWGRAATEDEDAGSDEASEKYCRRSQFALKRLLPFTSSTNV